MLSIIAGTMYLFTCIGLVFGYWNGDEVDTDRAIALR